MSRKINSCATGNEWPDNERPRECILGHGAQALSDVQLLAMRKTDSSDKGVVGLAIAFHYTYEHLLNLDSALGANRAAITGIETAKIAQGKAVFEAQCNDSTPIFFSSSAIHSYIRRHTHQFVFVSPSGIKEAIRASSVSLIFIHNHPSGNPTPSPDDIFLTAKRKQAGDVIGIAALGHIIICDVHM